MSNIAIKGATTGTGTFTIESPATNTDRTLTLPDEAGTFVTADASGNVDVSGDLTASGQVLVNSTTNTAAVLNVDTNGSNTSSGYGLSLRNTAGGGSTWTMQCGNYAVDNGDFTLRSGGIGGSTRLAVDPSGGAVFYKSGNVNNIWAWQNDAGGYCYATYAQNNGGTYYHFNFTETGSQRGSITSNGSSTSYNTGSDYRLKENVVDMTGAIDRVKQLNPSQFNFIGSDATVDGFIAHEVADVVPEAIVGEKDAVDDENNPIYQQIDQSKLVPLLTGALQEAIARIETLEAEVATLKGASA